MTKKKKSKISLSLKSHNELRNCEFVGDALLSFIVRDFFYKQGIERNLTRSKVYEIVSNKHLALVFDNLKLELDANFRKNNTLYKAKANQIEYYIYELYNKNGLETTKEFIIQKIISFYYLNKENEHRNKKENIL
jgi:23S rRNA maturation mini-RNase III